MEIKRGLLPQDGMGTGIGTWTRKMILFPIKVCSKYKFVIAQIIKIKKNKNIIFKGNLNYSIN